MRSLKESDQSSENSTETRRSDSSLCDDTMARPPRIHVPGGTYYIIERTSPGRSLFAEPNDYFLLEELLANALTRMNAHGLAYCWLPHSLHLVVQTESTPIGRVLQGFMSHYARSVHERTTESGHLFAGHYSSLLIEPSEWLAPLIRYIHFLPVLTCRAEDPEAYEHTSHHVYLGRRRLAWIESRRGLGFFAQSNNREAYASFMRQKPTHAEIHAFTVLPRIPVLGTDEFKARLPYSAREHRSSLSLEQIITQVSRLLQIRKEDLTLRSRSRGLAFARALIAWHATERNVATLAEVARRLHRDPSTLSLGMRRHRAQRPEWFTLDALRHMKAIAEPRQ